jgi:hypothetical protein
MADGPLLSMSEAFARYCQLYVPDVGAMDVRDFAQLKGAFAAGLNLGMAIAALPTARAEKQVEHWMAEVAPFWEEPQS